jgi:hypothetical protein
LAKRWKSDLAERTYYRGMNELLAKGFLFRTLAADQYFVNVRFMFNGDRMILMESYRKKGALQMREIEGPDIAALPAPAEQ